MVNIERGQSTNTTGMSPINPSLTVTGSEMGLTHCCEDDQVIQRWMRVRSRWAERRGSIGGAAERAERRGDEEVAMMLPRH